MRAAEVTVPGEVFRKPRRLRAAVMFKVIQVTDIASWSPFAWFAVRKCLKIRVAVSSSNESDCLVVDPVHSA